jgi:DNA gyrase subunit A
VIDHFPLRGRGGQGVIAQALSEKSGKLIGAVEVHDRHEIMLISDGGRLIRIAASEIKQLGRNTQGVRIARPTEGDKLVGLDRIEAAEVALPDVAADAPELPEADAGSDDAGPEISPDVPEDGGE